MIQRWFQLFLGVAVSQVAWGASFWAAPTPWHALGASVGTVAAVMIFLLPQLGIFLLSGLLIGQWPWNLMSYLTMLTSASSAAWLLINHKRPFPPNAILWITSLYFLVGLASTINPKTTVDIRSQILALAGHCAIVWLFVTLMCSRQRLLITTRLLVFSGLATAIIGLVQWRMHFVWITSTTYNVLAANSKAFRNKTGFELQGWRGEFRIDSITGTPDYLPLYMQCLLPFVGLWIVRQKSWSRVIAGMVVFGILGIAHILSYTRGALLTTAVVVFLLAWMIDRKRLLFYGPIVTLIALMAMLSWGPLRDRLVSIFTLSSAETSDRINTGDWRLRTIPVALEMISERPFFGVGLGQQKWNWPDKTIGVLMPDPKEVDPIPIHNDYLLVPVELGLGGLLVLLVLLATSIRNLYWLASRYARAGDVELADLARGTLLAMVGIAIAMPMYPMVENFRYFWLLLGMAAALMRLQQECEALPSTSPNSL